MKRYISMGLCMLLALSSSAQKVLIVHKTDGTKIEVPVMENPKFYTTGKAIVHDDDYTRILGTSVEIPNDYPEMPTITVNFQQNCEIEHQGGGICYATTPNVNVSNGTCISWDSDFVPNEDATIEFIAEHNTTYYIRSYAMFMGEYYYSEEKIVHVDAPSMHWYREMLNPILAGISTCLIPTQQAWDDFISQNKRHSQLLGLSSNQGELLTLWICYLTEEKSKQLTPLCEQYICNDGVLYVLNSIGDEFVQFILEYCSNASTLSGYSELGADSINTSLSFIECEQKWNVPNNSYWEYKPLNTKSNIEVRMPLVLPVLADYNYKFKITLAPDVEQCDTLSTKIRVKLESPSMGGMKQTIIVKDLITNLNECTTIIIEPVTMERFGSAILQIESNVSATQFRKGTYSRTLRIAQVEVIPIGPNIEE